MMNEKILKAEERAVFALRSLYRQYGYLPYKMSKFEEYEIYARNKEFLASDRIITFNDTNGKLMALKPDVTLSIIKNGEDLPGVKRKVSYNESVYRVSGGTHRFREIMQTGLECVGDIDDYDIYEVVYLAARSLESISPDYVLDISHLGILSSFLEETGADEPVRKELAACVAGKNRHDLEDLCRKNGIGSTVTEKLCRVVDTYGAPEDVIRMLEPICGGTPAEQALDQLRSLAGLLKRAGVDARVRFDFSIVNDMNYYNGIVFRGYLAGVCEGILSGGQYGNLMRRMGRRSDAIGFAVSLDLLEELKEPETEADVDLLALYDETVSPEKLADAMAKAVAEGKCVSAQKTIPTGMRYREIMDLRKGAGK